jgi:serine phosphatase RsbU (regulator of sigma subunit)
MEVGGDWYDIIPIDDQRLLAVVGDVSGRGLRAATTMASLRFAIHAYAAQADPPETILSKLSKVLSVKSAGQIATALCALIDIREGRITLASAGHLPPLMLSDGTGRYLDSQVGVPIGVRDDARYQQTTLALPGDGTLLAFTDGLVERRGESLDLGLDRLRQAASANHAGLDELLHRLVDDLRAGAAEDDTAIVGIRWSRS